MTFPEKLHRKKLHVFYNTQRGRKVLLATNVRKKRGEVLLSLFTTSEGEGVMYRYEKAHQQPPQRFYTDLDGFNMSAP